jgi:hypothetical protein
VDFIEDKSHKTWIATMNGLYSCNTRFKLIRFNLTRVNIHSMGIPAGVFPEAGRVSSSFQRRE